jgi:hypothetical protein
MLNWIIATSFIWLPFLIGGLLVVLSDRGEK